jgi:predicted RND superfamily exporter protein
MRDIDFATILAVVLIVLLLFYSFRSVWAVLLVLYPLILGLLWAFAMVPLTVGSLNLITSFLTVILFGLGADYPIHIVKRFQIEIRENPLREALRLSFNDTGLSVIMSALTTAAGFVITIFSNFRGFFEFGLLSAFSIVTIMVAMFIPFPAALIIVWKFNGLKKLRPISRRAYIPRKPVTIILGLLTIAGTIITVKNLKFDYFLSNTEFKRDNYKNYQLINEKVERVYSGSMSPAAIYAAPSVEEMDSALVVLKQAQADTNSGINRIRSMRDFAPDSADYLARVDLINDLKDILSGEWVSELPDTAMLALVHDFVNWQVPTDCPQINEIPEIISDNLLGNKGSGYFLINIFPTHERKDGRVAISLTKELNTLKVNSDVKGPVGESVIFADVLSMVLGEAWWIVVFGQLLVFLVVMLFQKNLKQTLLMFIPLTAGLLITFGIYGLLGIKITFFSVICIPALMGMGVDGGIHYVNRWYFRNKDLRQTQIELFEPLSAAFLTVIFGYIGMTLSSHSGLQSIGLLSSLGMFVIWIMNLIFLPGLLGMKKNKNEIS